MRGAAGYRLVDSRQLSEQDHLILKVLRLYYEHDLTQAEVARRMGFSRPKVSKLISEGRARGLVKIEIAEPAGDFAALEIALEDRYGLTEAMVVDVREDRRSTELSAGGAGGALLARLCTAESVLGVSWGTSLRALADALPHRAFACKRIVPLVGGMGKAKTELHSNQICVALAEKVGGEYLQLAAPAIASSAESRAELMELPGIGDTLAEAAACDVAVVGIGGILPTSTMVGAGYFTPEEFLRLRNRGAVGDVCCHFLNACGEPCLPDLSARIIGVTPEQLREIPRTIGIATGPEKAPGVAAVLRSGCVDTLVCDRRLAEELLDIPPREGGSA
ncbi:sugar-binding transcriptional regulator [Rubrobacter taiwanensis]|jgi:deoxyribonucleoside regulator|uniref:Sugar-binding transcriptional regulator n=1 Tax=Rubrobacter taiwanensis TaxID=185139 RepID=A0A4R1BNE5_9ACTN|nr:sugar-binding transcriptional regulator [Rubrobacter taiwanensis]TCJ18898.1 sugar-binding transcriptional regulator [Rubrobacter taiwanensis]